MKSLSKGKIENFLEDLREKPRNICRIVIQIYFQSGEKKEFEYQFEYEVRSELHIDDKVAKFHAEVFEKISMNTALFIKRSIQYKEDGKNWTDGLTYAPALRTDKGFIHII